MAFLARDNRGTARQTPGRAAARPRAEGRNFCHLFGRKPYSVCCPQHSKIQPVFADGEPLDVPAAMELLSWMKRQKGAEDLTCSRTPVTGFGWEVAYRAGRRGIDMNGAFQRVTLGPNIDPSDNRERTR